MCTLICRNNYDEGVAGTLSGVIMGLIVGASIITRIIDHMCGSVSLILDTHGT